jgi:Ca-activated chloride channel family protein
VKLRYQSPAGGASRLVSRVVRTGERGAPETLGFAAAVAEFGMLLRNSEHKGTSSWEDVLRLSRSGMGRDPGGYRAEFVRLVEVARGMSGKGAELGMAE